MLPDLETDLLSIKQRNLYRRLVEIGSPHDPVVALDRNEVLLFCSNNYLGLASDPRVKNAAIECIETYGVSAPASRLISGHTPVHAALESDLARFFGTQAALVFPSGYAANTGIIPALMGLGDTIFSDRLNHRSLIDGIRLSKAEPIIYEHLDVSGLTAQMGARSGEGRKMIVTDGVFSMDGDLAPLDQLSDLAAREDAILMVDDAHGSGIFGEGGRGTPESPDVNVDIWMTSLSKGFGTFGGAVAGQKDLIESLVNRSATFIYTTALPPDICAATSAALEIIQAEPERRVRLLKLSNDLRSSLNELGFDTFGSRSHIIPIKVGDAAQTVAMADFLLDRGIFVLAIRPPTIPDGTSRLRISLMATHTDTQVAHLLDALVEARSLFRIEEKNPT